MKINLILLFLIIAGSVAAQNSITIEGYIFSEDSLPAGNAYLINYHSSKISVADKDGYFKISAQEGDSLMINHISLYPKVVYADSIYAGANKIYVPYRTYILKAIASRNYEKEMENMKETMQQTKREINNMQVLNPSHFESEGNPYNPDKPNPGLTIPILQLGKKNKKKVPSE